MDRYICCFIICVQVVDLSSGQLIPQGELKNVTSCDLQTTLDVTCGSNEFITIYSLYFYYHPTCDSICCGYDSSHFSSGADESFISEVRRVCSGRNTCSLEQLDGVRDFGDASLQESSYVVIKYYCIPDCGVPANVTGATVTTSRSNLESSIAKYACDEGYMHTSGDLQRTCRSDSTWNGTLPTCTPDCGTPPESIGTNVTTSAGSLENSVAAYVCKDGFTHTSGNLQRTCGADSIWSGTLPICTPVECGTPPDSMGAAVTTSAGTLENSVATYVCQDGFTHTSGNLQRTCVSDSNWNGTLPTCTPDCGAPVNVIGATVTTLNSNLESSIATYVCEEGYKHTSGDLQRTCRSDSTWSGTLPICTRDCGTPNAPANGTIIIDVDGRTIHLSTATVTCISGFYPTTDTIVCQASGTWEEVHCVITDCGKLPQITDGKFVLDKEQDTTFVSSATVVCDIDYTATVLKISCQANGSWENASCKINDCGVPNAINNGIISLDVSGRTTYLSTATVSCEQGFDASSNLTSCQASGVWQNVSCVIIDCATPYDIPNGKVTPVVNGSTAFGARANVICDEGFKIKGLCAGTQFQCGDGTCIDNSLWCDNLPDCDDKLDELLCYDQKSCLEGQVLCGTRCIDSQSTCDGIQHKIQGVLLEK